MSSLINIALNQCRNNTRTSLAGSTRLYEVFGNTSRRMYHENIIEHYENPRNVGSLDVSLSSLLIKNK